MKREIQVIGDYLWDRALARAVDRLTSDQYHIPAVVLMEAAGKGVADTILELEPDEAPVVFLCGPGSNGGDGLVAARHVAEAGVTISVFLVADPGKTPSAACQHQIDVMRALGHRLEAYERGALKRHMRDEPIVVDALLGTGFEGPLAESSLLHAALSEAALIDEATVIAVDVPSGLDADSGDAQELPLPADVTVTFGGRKPAHVLSPARDACGEVLSLSIGFPMAAQNAALGIHKPRLILPDPKELLRIDPWSKLGRSAHKYDRGHVLVIGGSPGKTGAPLLAAMAALRAGAGWASVAMPRTAYDSLRGDVPREVTFEELFEGEALNAIKLEHFLEERRVRAVVCGPGAMTSPLTPEALGVLSEFSEDGGFVVLDAGATHGLENLLGASPQNPERWLAVPHPGEWTRMGASFDASPLNPSGLKKAAARADELGIALLFKNAAPLLIPGSPDMPSFVTAEGDSSLARAGSGDVLAGVAGAHGAIGLGSVIAALRSQVLVAWAAKLAAEERGRHAVTATDIIRCLGRVPAELEALEAGDEEDEDDLLDEDEDHDEPEPPRSGPPSGRGAPQARGHRPWQRRR